MMSRCAYCLAISILIAASCAAGVPLEKTVVYVSIAPQAYFVERVGAPHVQAQILVAAGQSPETYEPSPRQMAELEDAAVYFTLGFPFENRLTSKLASMYPTLPIVAMHDDRQGHDAHDHSHDDPHTWLAPFKVKHMAQTVAAELTRLRPSHAEEFRLNALDFASDLDSLDARLRAVFDSVQAKRFYVFHPAFGHFAAAYGLTQVAFEEHGKEPGARRLALLMDQARGDSATVIFVEPQFSEKHASTVADAIGADLVALDPLARDYLRNIELIGEKIAAALRGERIKP